MFDKAIEILSRKKTGLIIVFVAIAARIALQLYFFAIGGDRSFQLVAAKSFAEGHGFSIPQLLPDSLGRQVYVPVVGWPPGYSIFLLPLYFVCGKNIIAAAIFFDIITATMFVIVARKILQLLNVAPWLVSLYTLLSGFFIYDFAAAPSSDFCTLTLFLVAVYCILVFIKGNEPPIFGVLAGVLLFTCSLTRYMYMPIVLPAALYLVYWGYLKKDKRLLSGSYYCLSVLIFLLACLYLYQYQVTGSATHIISSKKGFYPGNLLRTNAFLFTPFIDTQVFCTTFSSLFKISYSKLSEAIWRIHLLPYCITVFFCMAFLIRRVKAEKNISGHYVYLGILFSLSTILLLTFLSLTNALVSNVTNPGWTFVEEPRYYGFIILFIHQLLFIYLFKSRIRSKVQKAFVLCIAILLGIQVLHGIYFVTKKLIIENQNFTAYKETKAMNHFFCTSLDSLQRRHVHKQVIAISNDGDFQNLAVLRGYKAVYEDSFLKDPSKLEGNKNMVLLVALHYQVVPQYKKVLQLPAAKFIGTIGQYYFYMLET